jgi:hypothetical protein
MFTLWTQMDSTTSSGARGVPELWFGVVEQTTNQTAEKQGCETMSDKKIERIDGGIEPDPLPDPVPPELDIVHLEPPDEPEQEPPETPQIDDETIDKEVERLMNEPSLTDIAVEQADIFFKQLQGKEIPYHLTDGKKTMTVTEATSLSKMMKVYDAATIYALIPRTVDWLWEYRIARKRVTVISAPPKEGKTWFVSDFIKHMQFAPLYNNDFLGLKVNGCGILYFTEEGPDTLEEPFKWTIGAQFPKEIMPVFYACRPFNPGNLWHQVAPSGHEPYPTVLNTIRSFKAEYDIGMVVIDSFSTWAGIEEGGENVAGQINKVLIPLKALAVELNLAVVLVHHSRKQSGEWRGSIIDRVRGSTAFTANVDVIIDIQDPNFKSDNTVRTISVTGRLPPKVSKWCRAHLIPDPVFNHPDIYTYELCPVVCKDDKDALLHPLDKDAIKILTDGQKHTRNDVCTVTGMTMDQFNGFAKRHRVKRSLDFPLKKASSINPYRYWIAPESENEGEDGDQTTPESNEPDDFFDS